MTAKRAFLKAVMTTHEGKSTWSGEYVCSGCELRFRPDPTEAGKLTAEFACHAVSQHTPAKLEDDGFGQAARDREATESK
jgi:hypothetical protein